jgi:hypothetical protein
MITRRMIQELRTRLAMYRRTDLVSVPVDTATLHVLLDAAETALQPVYSGPCDDDLDSNGEA